MAGSGAALIRANEALARIQSLSNGGASNAALISSSDNVGGSLWTTMAGFINALLGGRVTNSLPTRAQIAINSVPAVITTITTSGLISAGDGGDATYVRASGPFTDGASFQSADGAWWQYQPETQIKAAQFGVIADGYSFSNGAISAGALNKLVLPASGWKTSAVAVGNPIVVIGGAGNTTIAGVVVPTPFATTIAAISGNTITLAAPVVGAISNVSGNFGTDNTAAWAKIVAYAQGLANVNAAASLQPIDAEVRLPYGIICFSGTLYMPDCISPRGWGSRGTQFLAMAASAQVVTTVSSSASAGGSYGQSFSGFSVHGNNITTSPTGLVHCQANGASFNDFRVWWSLGDGLFLDDAQNCQGNNCSFAANGNPAASFYTFTVSGVTVAPAAGAVYTNNSQSYQVLSSSITSGSGTVFCVGTGAAAANGNLANNNGGTGDLSITFSSVSGGGQTGANIRFTNNSCSNIFVRSEIPNTPNFGVIFEGGVGQNVLLLGEVEIFKGQYADEYYPTSLIKNPTITNVLCDGGAGATPYGYSSNICNMHLSSFYGDVQGRAAPHMILRNGGTHIVDSVGYEGDNSTPATTVFCQFGPSGVNPWQNILICQGTNDVDGNGTVLYDAHPTANQAAVQVFGQFSGNFGRLFNPGVTGQQTDYFVTTPANAALNLASGHLHFPATQRPSSDNYTLDDYNEFAFTPAIAIGGQSAGITYSFGPYGNGIKIGQKVSGCGNMVITSIAALTGAITITGLPYAASGYQSNVGFIVFPVLNGVALGSGNQLIGTMAPGSSAIIVNLSGASGTSAATQAILSGPTTIEFAFEYQAVA